MGLKLGPDVLTEIVAIVQKGLFEGADVSQELRDLDLTVSETDDTIYLTDEYLSARGRGRV